jgi:hypothetical protein
MLCFSVTGGVEAPVMDQQPSRKGKLAAQIAGTVAALLFWGFGLEYMLQTYVFVSPPAISVQHSK